MSAGTQTLYSSPCILKPYQILTLNCESPEETSHRCSSFWKVFLRLSLACLRIDPLSAEHPQPPGSLSELGMLCLTAGGVLTTTSFAHTHLYWLSSSYRD